MIRRFEFDVDVTRANEHWDAEVARNLERLGAVEGAATPTPART